MSDLVSKQDVFNTLKKVGLCAMSAYLFEKIWASIEALPSAEPKRKWIPVSDAWPINDVDVIVSVLDNSGDTPYRFTSVGWCTPNGQYWVVDNEMCYGVIAWMPLPEPWGGER